MVKQSPAQVLEARVAELARWLADEAPYVQFDQDHLDAGTQPQAYWHLGYRAALLDALTLIRSEVPSDDGASISAPVEGEPDA